MRYFVIFQAFCDFPGILSFFQAFCHFFPGIPFAEAQG
jgi:hypothetical protein